MPSSIKRQKYIVAMWIDPTNREEALATCLWFLRRGRALASKGTVSSL